MSFFSSNFLQILLSLYNDRGKRKKPKRKTKQLNIKQRIKRIIILAFFFFFPNSLKKTRSIFFVKAKGSREHLLKNVIFKQISKMEQGHSR